MAKKQREEVDETERTVFQKFLASWKSEVDLERKELMMITFWFKMVLSLILGVVAGFLPYTGWPVIVGYFLIVFIVINFYYSKILDVDSEEYGQEMLTEGGFNGFFAFLWVWILIYNLKYHSLDL
mmetsp:Transcript_27273/g.31473  ORF Transcript_27273/g.31473 Transcript_27273/m.31473 type:complete len:125 (+) Transcript_27273:80-454(+)